MSKPEAKHTYPTDSDIQWVICEAKMDQYINRTLNY